MKAFTLNKNSEYECQECHQTFKTLQGIGNHVGRIHDKKEYYDKFFKKENEEFCPICGKLNPFKRWDRGYNKTCSTQCSHILTKQNMDITMLKRYGVINCQQNKKIKQKTSETNIKKFGNA